MVGLYGKIPIEMDDDWGYPYFRKPPYTYTPHLVVLHAPSGDLFAKRTSAAAGSVRKWSQPGHPKM